MGIVKPQRQRGRTQLEAAGAGVYAKALFATADTLGATALTCDRSWPRVSRRARLI